LTLPIANNFGMDRERVRGGKITLAGIVHPVMTHSLLRALHKLLPESDVQRCQETPIPCYAQPVWLLSGLWPC